ncbi:Mucin-5AC (fragment) [metagenome]|uniref:Mucin-5AC n=1 Tax=metagenome TaxID=256318 RepID=A0A2P2C7X2_9ZZZZ
MRQYYEVRNQLRQNPSQPLSLLDSVAISTELAAQQNLFKRERKQGLHQVGRTEVAKLEVQSVNLDNSDPKAGKVPTVQVDLCFDVSDVDVVDADGKSVVSPDRPDTGWIQFLVSNYEWTSDPGGGWRVASSQDIERKPCEAS